ncbi:hypothetical protein GCM10010112_87400 [Actinoplanes lobatus]|uniref:GNAT superfamily N-acetyltransferase n=2 Tax=Actinoplanes lobatus TaxID=113568 RepID=A0A7W7MLS4_9ACTN|nr:GNAT superfamily N-acetyltransferase [Actinoplanes lobatus]GGN96281.1 hypothetical protein GCM10010112_87400 [Actinoplanes lobatus]GIE46381.1 hypothetical protein Alo02nite_92790 [Actinoplanes lobatus]
MIVARSHAGLGIGGKLLAWVSEKAAEAGRHWLRLDAWRTNPHLHAYYLGHGFRHVRTIDLPHRGSGALFQRAISAPS